MNERPSPIAAERCVGARELTEPRLSPDGRLLGYVASINAHAMIMVSTLDGAPPRQLTTHPVVRAGRGLGGGAWCWTGDAAAIVYVGVDGNLWRQPVPGGTPTRVTDLPPERGAQAPVASGTLANGGCSIAYVIDHAEVWVIEGDRSRRIDDGGADFCSDPTMDSSGDVIAWQAWNVPHMPWDAARICRYDLRAQRMLDPLAVGEDVAAQQPQLIDGSLWSVRDDNGWLNVWCDDRVVVDEPHEHADPSWGMGQRSVAVAPGGRRVAFARNEQGFGRLCVAAVDDGPVISVARGVHGQLSWAGNRIAAIRTGARTPTQIVVYTETGLAEVASGKHATRWVRSTIDIGPVSGWEDEPLVEPTPIEATARDGATLYARFYAADAAALEAGRLIVWIHGGPTDQWQVTFMPRISFWLSRGWNVLVVDHRGSSGHGRAYQQALRHRWGELDVSDTIDLIGEAHRQGWGSPERTVVMGGSAGGFTALGVLAVDGPRLAAAGVVSYPVTDLFDLGERSHRFERHYTDSLVGPQPSHRNAPGPYTDRSPLNFAARITAPVLISHGDADPVVPVEQSRELAAAIATAGGIVELRVYPGEGHGFRALAHQLEDYQRTSGFLREHVQ